MGGVQLKPHVVLKKKKPNNSTHNLTVCFTLPGFKNNCLYLEMQKQERFDLFRMECKAI